MRRDIDRLTARTFDVLVVGGGIYGLAVAYDAAQRGLSVALIERDDFGGGISFNHSRTIHGGLRYLQSLDLRRARESLRERRTLARIAPHAVEPMRFVLPLDTSLTRGPIAMRAGFALDRLVAFDRNEGVLEPLRLPGGRVVARSEVIRACPILRDHQFESAAVWHDYVTPESDRLTFAFALAAERHGAVLANYVEASGPLLDGRRVAGMRAVDRRSGRELDIGARVTVNAAGAGVDVVAGPLGAAVRKPLLKAMNLVTSRSAGDAAIGSRAASGRHWFLVPWRKRALFGTWESSRACEPGDAAVAESEVAAFIRDLNRAFPSLQLTFDDVTLVHRGVVPAAVRHDGTVSLEGRERIHDHAADGYEGLVTVAGTKYTTARAVAERITDRIIRKLKRAHPPCRTATTPLFDGNASEPASDSGERRRLIAAYGPAFGRVIDLGRECSAWLEPVSADVPVTGAELVWATREEMVVTLRDAVIRRTPLGSLGYPGDAALEWAAEIVGAELGWPADRRREEISAVKRFYTPFTR